MQSNVVKLRQPAPNRNTLKPIGRPCATCGDPLMARSSRDFTRKKFCSWKCAGNASKIGERRRLTAPDERTCVRCDAQFMGRSSTKYCSIKCCNAAASDRLNRRRESLHHHLSTLLRRDGRASLSKAFLLDLYETQLGRCALTGVPMTWRASSGFVAENISIDRIVAKGPYVPGNVRLVCRVANLMRRDMSDDHFVEWCRRVCDFHRNKDASDADAL